MLNAARPHYRWRAGVRYGDLDATAALKDTTLPVLIIYSRDDELTPPYMAEQYEQAAGDNATMVWTTGPHSVAYMEKPDQYRQWLEDFRGRCVDRNAVLFLTC